MDAKIAVLCDEYLDYRRVLVDTIAAENKRHGFNTLCVCGRELNPRQEFEQDFALGNEIYNVATGNEIKGIICLSGAIGHNISLDGLEQFLQRFDCPKVSLGLPVPNISNVSVNDAAGMIDLMRHLIGQKRGSDNRPVERFAFIQGFDNDPYSMQREQIFRSELAQAGLSADERLIINGEYDAFETYRAVTDLLTKFGHDIDVIVAANDCMALGAARAAAVCGFDIPQDLLISGFDDTSEASQFSPAITTVRQPLEQMAQASVTLLLEQIAAQEQSHKPPCRVLEVNSELVIRGSTRAVRTEGQSQTKFHRQQIHAQISQALSGLSQPVEISLVAITDALYGTLVGEEPGLGALVDKTFLRQIRPGHQHWWLNLCFQIEACSRRVYTQDSPRLTSILACLTLIKERSWAISMDQQFQLRRDQSAHATMQLQMSSSTRLTHITATTRNWLTQITPRRFFLVIFDNPGDQLPPRARLVHTHMGRRQLPSVDADFDTTCILPNTYAKELEDGLLLLYPVFAGDMYFGYLLLDPEGIELAEMSSVASSIGNAMRNRYMIMQLQKQAVNLQDANMELEQLANFDALTGLPNRFNFHKRLEQTFTNSCSTGRDLCVMYVDLDGFKTINDTNGHKAGDQVLVNVAQRLQKTVASQFDVDGFVARLGGDEFTLILENFESETSVAMLADRIIEQIAQPIAVSQQRVAISASIGYVLLSHNSIKSGATNIEALLHRADSAMYRAKQTGKNRTCVYDARLAEAESERRQLESKLQHAIRQGELTVHYQPRIDTETGAIRGAEALMRWLDSDGERVIAYPDEFIPLAESCGMIHDLDLLALNQCCKQVRAWLDVGIELSVSVNISVVHLQMDNFVSRVIDTIASHRIRCNQIELEITEGAVMTDVERCIEKLQALRFAGVRISIDDFGTGYSSLSYLKKLPITNLKIDRSFLLDITDVDTGDCADAAIVRTIVALGNTMDIGLIAEGIETQVQLDFIRELGVEEAQGYYFYRPVAATEMTRILLAQQTAQAA